MSNRVLLAMASALTAAAAGKPAIAGRILARASRDPLASRTVASIARAARETASDSLLYTQHDHHGVDGPSQSFKDGNDTRIVQEGSAFDFGDEYDSMDSFAPIYAGDDGDDEDELSGTLTTASRFLARAAKKVKAKEEEKDDDEGDEDDEGEDDKPEFPPKKDKAKKVKSAKDEDDDEDEDEKEEKAFRNTFVRAFRESR
jgi:hypothetical protein